MSINEKLENLRCHYMKNSLDFGDCDPNPVVQFEKWFDESLKSECDEPNAFVLSTISNSRPRGRVVLLKGIHKGQFIFYSNYLSAKGHEIEENVFVSMTFLWLPLQRQVRIEGKAIKVESVLSDDYFQKRPRGNQIGAIASPQSQRVSSRQELEELFEKADKKLLNSEVLPRPQHWGGYSIEPDYVEFWQGRESRMHDRIIYEKSNDKWNLSRLAP
jgi:pyridoxamine 5'-phosphate oxidase